MDSPADKELYDGVTHLVETHGVESVVEMLGDVCDERHHRAVLSQQAIVRMSNGNSYGAIALRLWNAVSGVRA